MVEYVPTLHLTQEDGPTAPSAAEYVPRGQLKQDPLPTAARLSSDGAYVPAGQGVQPSAAPVAPSFVP